MSKPTDYNYWLGVVGFGNPEVAIALNSEFNRLEARLAAAEAVCEAASALDLHLQSGSGEYVITNKSTFHAHLVRALEAWRKLREDKP